MALPCLPFTSALARARVGRFFFYRRFSLRVNVLAYLCFRRIERTHARIRTRVTRVFTREKRAGNPYRFMSVPPRYDKS